MPNTTGPTLDPHTAQTRFLALIDARPGRSAAPRLGRDLVRQAVYGDLWTPARVGEVPPQDRPALRALASQINSAVFPGGAYARSVTAAQVRTLWPEAASTQPAN